MKVKCFVLFIGDIHPDLGHWHTFFIGNIKIAWACCLHPTWLELHLRAQVARCKELLFLEGVKREWLVLVLPYYLGSVFCQAIDFLSSASKILRMF